MTSEYLHAQTCGGLGELVLDRPKALNALDPGMIHAIAGSLETWLDDSSIKAVLFRGNGGKAFCSGGDVRTVRQQRLDSDESSAAAFFRDEYAMNLQIAEYPKTTISIIDGICMGGGIGVAGHCRIRVVTEKALLAMPETAIGFIPDVGSTYLLPRTPGNLGRYLGVTSARMNGWDALWAGLATAFVPSDRIDELLAALQAEPASAEAIVNRFAIWPEDATTRPQLDSPAWTEVSPMAAHRALIDRLFASADLREILDAVIACPEDYARGIEEALRSHSPAAMRQTLELLANPLPSVGESLQRELVTALDMITRPDFMEGVRCVLVDKGDTPTWEYPTIADLP